MRNRVIQWLRAQALECDGSRLESEFCHILAVLVIWGSLRLSLFICKLGIIVLNRMVVKSQ